MTITVALEAAMRAGVDAGTATSKRLRSINHTFSDDYGTMAIAQDASKAAVSAYMAALVSHPTPSGDSQASLPIGDEGQGWDNEELAVRVLALADAVEDRFGGIRTTFNHGGVGRDGGSLSVKEVCDMLAKMLRTGSPR